jgi:hypothetical protein
MSPVNSVPIYYMHLLAKLNAIKNLLHTFGHSEPRQRMSVEAFVSC